MHRGGNHRAGNAQTLTDVAFHLGAKDHLGLEGGNRRFNLKIVVGNQGLDTVLFSQSADWPGHFTVKATKPDNLKPHLIASDAGGGGHMGAVTKQEHPLASQIGAIDRTCPPRQAQACRICAGRQAGDSGHFGNEIMRGSYADRDAFGIGLLKLTFEPAGSAFGVFWIHQHVEMRRPHAGNVRRARAHGGADVDCDAHVGQQPRHLGDVIAVTKAKGGRAYQVGGHVGGAVARLGQMPHDLQESLVGAETFLALIAGQIQGDHGDAQIHAFCKPARVILNKLSCTRRAHNHRFGGKTGNGILAGGLEQTCRVAAQIAGLKRSIADRRAMVAPFDHGEQKVGIGIALRRVQDIVQAAHASGDAHCANMRRAFVCPQRQLHSAASRLGAKGASKARRRRGRANSAARSPACS